MVLMESNNNLTNFNNDPIDFNILLNSDDKFGSLLHNIKSKNSSKIASENSQMSDYTSKQQIDSTATEKYLISNSKPLNFETFEM